MYRLVFVCFIVLSLCSALYDFWRRLLHSADQRKTGWGGPLIVFMFIHRNFLLHDTAICCVKGSWKVIIIRSIKRARFWWELFESVNFPYVLGVFTQLCDLWTFGYKSCSLGKFLMGVPIFIPNLTGQFPR